MSYSEKRCSGRFAASWNVNVQGQEGPWNNGHLIDVSTQGLKLYAPAGYQIGESVSLAIHAGDGSLVRCVGHVVREYPDWLGAYAYGLEFDSFEEDGYAVLKKALRAIREGKNTWQAGSNAA